jgi:hypothetical protein
MSSAFYPGAGRDIIPFLMFPGITDWICIDSLPNSEYGYDHADYAHPKFIENLTKIMEQNGFIVKCIDGDTYTFCNQESNQTVRYETNSNFPNCLQQRHYDCDTLVLCGFDIGEKKYDFINKYSNIITNNITYCDSEDEPLLLSKKVSTIIIDNEWEYWEYKNHFPDIIKKYVTVEPRFITKSTSNVAHSV